MLRAALVVLSVATTATVAIAQSTGIAICDEFLNKFEICVRTKLPAEMRAIVLPQVDQMRKMVLDNAKEPTGRPIVEKTCKSQLESFKKDYQVYGCTF
jgi:hypothetical protein